MNPLRIFTDAILWFCIGWDVLDFFVGVIPIVSDFMDILGTFIGYWLFGGIGLINAWEIPIGWIPEVNIVDGFVPTMTITYLLSRMVKG